MVFKLDLIFCHKPNWIFCMYVKLPKACNKVEEQVAEKQLMEQKLGFLINSA